MEAQRCRPTICTGTLYSSSRKREAENFGWPRGAAFSILCLIRTSMALHLYRQHGVTPSTPRLGRKQGDDCGLLLSILNNAKLRKRAASATYSQYLCALAKMPWLCMIRPQWQSKPLKPAQLRMLPHPRAYRSSDEGSGPVSTLFAKGRPKDWVCVKNKVF